MTATIRKQSVSWANTASCAPKQILDAALTISDKSDSATFYADAVYITSTSTTTTFTKHCDSFKGLIDVNPQPNWFVAREKTEGYLDADDFERQLISEDPAFAKSMLRARQKLSTSIGATGLKAIRLAAGLSQAQLAELIGTSQPHIARLEKSPEAMYLETAVKLSHALNIDLKEIATAAGLAAVKK